MSKIKEMQAKKADIRFKALEIISTAQTEGRFLTDNENKLLSQYETDMRNWDISIEKSETFGADEPQIRSNEPVINTINSKIENRFNTFGEQLRAVYSASFADNKIDNKLTTRAATGVNETTTSDGGFLVQKDFISELLKNTYETGILASRARKVPVSSGANGIKINAIDETSRADGSRFGGLQAFWQGEADTITSSKPKFRQIDMSLKKLTGLCYATDELLADTTALESIISQGFAEEFGFKIDDAIINGTGIGEPLGILKSSSLVTVPKEASQTSILTVENIVKMWSRLWTRSRSNAVWFINSELEAELFTLKLGDTPAYLPPSGLSQTPYGTLMGRPVIPLEQCNSSGEVGDIILADLSQYLLIDKGGINAASSIHVRFLNDESVFRFVYRLDGTPIWNSPITPYKGSSTISPFVTLAKRSV